MQFEMVRKSKVAIALTAVKNCGHVGEKTASQEVKCLKKIAICIRTLELENWKMVESLIVR